MGMGERFKRVMYALPVCTISRSLVLTIQLFSVCRFEFIIHCSRYSNMNGSAEQVMIKPLLRPMHDRHHVLLSPYFSLCVCVCLYLYVHSLSLSIFQLNSCLKLEFMNIRILLVSLQHYVYTSILGALPQTYSSLQCITSFGEAFVVYKCLQQNGD